MKRYILAVFLVCSIFCLGCLGKQDLLQKKYPFARLTPDYGILNETDLWLSEQNADPVPLEKNSMAYPYWQCFPTAAFKFLCRSLEADDHDSLMADLEIRVQSNDFQFEEFSGRRGIELSGCAEARIEWKKLIEGEQYACISGLAPDIENKKLNGKSVRIRGWLYDRFKTRKGCTGWFGDACDPKARD